MIESFLPDSKMMPGGMHEALEDLDALTIGWSSIGRSMSCRSVHSSVGSLNSRSVGRRRGL